MHDRDERPCPACGAAAGDERVVDQRKRGMTGEPLLIVRCACGAAFQPRAPSLEELARHYDYMGHNPANVQSSPLLDRRLARMVRTLEPYRRLDRILEIGCGGGLFVRAATDQGWDVYGTEISPSCAAVLRPLMGSRLHEGTVDTAPFADGSFDAAVMIEVIEHLVDPLPYLVAIRRLLRPGGAIFLTTPNARGAAARALGTRWRAFGDEHLTLYDRRSLPRLLHRAGFDDVDVSTSNLDLLILAWQMRSRIPALRRRDSTAPTQAGRSSDSRDPTVNAPRRRRSLLAAELADVSIQAVNHIAAATRLGDTLKIVARRA